MTALAASRVFDGATMHTGATVEIEGGTVTALRAGASGEVLPPDWLLAPGFVDLQVNGAGGVLLNDNPTADAMAAIAAALAPLGTTALLPTLISARGKIAAACAAAEQVIARGVPGVLGVHIEGPFINAARRGMHPLREIAELREDDLALLAAPHAGVRLVTVAPECIDPGELGQLARSVALFAGHTDADWGQATTALQAGVLGFTHLFNAMSQFGSRAPGCVGAALSHARCCAGIIGDGVHVHPASLYAAWRAMGSDRLFFVSDCMSTVGGPNAYVWEGETITLSGDRLARADGTLAGAHVTMAESVARAVQVSGIPLTDALRMATATPARWVGARSAGRLAPGCRADLVALDDTLRVRAVWQGGRRLQ